jgi:hypothetical protein
VATATELRDHGYGLKIIEEIDKVFAKYPEVHADTPDIR